MKIPIMKREIHQRLIKRVLGAWLVALLLGLCGVTYLEYKNLDRSLLAHASKENKTFSTLLLSYLEKPDQEHLIELKKLAGLGMAQTSFVFFNLLDSTQKPVLSLSSSSADAAQAAFDARGITVIPGKKGDGVWLLANKRLYYKVAIPIFDNNGDLKGYTSGIYLVSLSESQNLLRRYLLSILICVTAISLCTLLCYLGFLFMNNHLIRSVGELNRTNIFLLKKLGGALAKSDCMDQFHSSRVLLYSLRLAEKVKLPREQRRNLVYGVFLHDIGMLPIDPNVLIKTDAFGDEDVKRIQQHPKDGAALIRKFRWLKNGEQIIRFHHEKYDGNGYPDGAKQEKIPMSARIFAIADTFDALTSDRPYRDALSLDKSLAILEQETGLQFDPVLLSEFLDIASQLFEAIHSLSPKALEKEVDKTLKKYLRYK